MTNLSDEERIRCDECFKKLFQTKIICIKAIQYLIEQQHEIDECIMDLKLTKSNAQLINRRISELDEISLFKFCFPSKKQQSNEIANINDENHFLILPFPNEQHFNPTYSVNQLKKDFQLDKLFYSMSHTDLQCFKKEDFENILHEQYTLLLHLAKALTKSIQILHDTIEFLGTDIKITLEHMQSAQPRMKQLLKMKAPQAFGLLTEIQ